MAENLQAPPSKTPYVPPHSQNEKHNQTNIHDSSNNGENKIASFTQSITDPSDPSYLLGNDMNTNSLLSFKLTGPGNFAIWSHMMKTALLTRNKLTLVDGRYTIPPEDSSLFATWERCNAMCLTWLFNSLSDEIHEGLMYMIEVADLWTELHDRYNQRDATRLYDVLNELSLVRQGGDSVTVYFNRLKKHWDEYAFLMDLDSPDMARLAPWKAHQERIKFYQFLRGLDECHVSLREHILLMKPLPDVKAAYSMVSKAEYRKELLGKTMEASGVFAI